MNTLTRFLKRFLVYFCLTLPWQVPAAPGEWEGLLFPPYQDVLEASSPLVIKQITMEMLGAVQAGETVYTKDEILLPALREFQLQHNIPTYDYRYCYAGPMTLNRLIELYVTGNYRAGSYFRELYQRHDPAENPGTLNLGGADIAEFQLMYNTWAEQNGRPPLITPGGADNGSHLLEVDGYFGKFTRAAARIFQNREPLLQAAGETNGTVGEKTWKLLYVRTYRHRDSIVQRLIKWCDNHLA